MTAELGYKGSAGYTMKRGEADILAPGRWLGYRLLGLMGTYFS